MLVRRGDGDFSRAFRPCRLSEVVGNDEAKRTLRTALENGRLPQNLLFHGISGTGKTTLAHIIMLGLNCEKGPTPEPCCECDSCKRLIGFSSHTAVQRLNAVEKNKDEFKQLLRNFMSYDLGAIEGYKYSILLIDEAHGLTKDQAELFLKPMEEGLDHHHFIFCTTKPDKMLDTLKNRCQLSLEFKKVPDAQIMKLLVQICEQDELQIDNYLLCKIISLADGMPRNALNSLQQAYLSKNIRKKSVVPRPGAKNVIVIAPHGIIDDDEYTNIIVEEMSDAEHLDSFAVINDKYRKPTEKRGLKPDAEKNLLDLNNTAHYSHLPAVKKEFLQPIEDYKSEILFKCENGLIVLIHGMKNENMALVAEKIAEYKDKPKKLQAIIGFGQNDDGEERYTADREWLIEPLIQKLKVHGIYAAIAPTEKIELANGEERSYCGHDSRRLNQYLADPDTGIQSVQLEFKKLGLRDDPDTARITGRLLADVFSEMEMVINLPDGPPSGQGDSPVRTSAQDGELVRIKAAEVDLEDTTFKARFEDMEEHPAFIELVQSIKSIGIKQNIIVRKTPSEGKFQLICGFRRMSALRKTLSQDEFAETLVPALVYEEAFLDEDAYHISFAENVLRKSLSLWEEANYCYAIRQRLHDEEPSRARGSIIKELMRIVNQEKRTVYDYLQIAAITDKEIRGSIHKGIISKTAALVFAREDLSESDREAIHHYYLQKCYKKNKPHDEDDEDFYIKNRPSDRSFTKFVRNLVELRNGTSLSITEILNIGNAEDFLRMNPNELMRLLKKRSKDTGRTYREILERNLLRLKGFAESEDARDTSSVDLRNVQDKTKYMEKKVARALDNKSLPGNVHILATGEPKERQIDIRIIGSVADMRNIIQAVSTTIGGDFDPLNHFFQLEIDKLQSEKKAAIQKKGRFNDWTTKNVNFCKGCSHGCLYCYAWDDALRREQIESRESWLLERIRQHDVDPKQPRYPVEKVGFPSSHDITPKILNEACIVLEKLLEAGNEVLIISKPHLECIERICTEFERFKSRIQFRFTITAMDTRLLSFWEPHAPSYSERRSCLKYAYDMGFETSVSAEPMLDTDKIDDLINDLIPYITEAIWLGPMNEIKRRVKIDSEEVALAVERIENGQTPERIQPIYEKYKDHPKVKFKSEIFKVLGIKPPPERQDKV